MGGLGRSWGVFADRTRWWTVPEPLAARGRPVWGPRAALGAFQGLRRLPADIRKLQGRLFLSHDSILRALEKITVYW